MAHATDTGYFFRGHRIILEAKSDSRPAMALVEVIDRWMQQLNNSLGINEILRGKQAETVHVLRPAEQPRDSAAILADHVTELVNEGMAEDELARIIQSHLDQYLKENAEKYLAVHDASYRRWHEFQQLLARQIVSSYEDYRERGLLNPPLAGPRTEA